MTNIDSLNNYKSISLKEMDKVSLLKRIDTKYVVSIKDLFQFLKSVESTHRILEINDKRTQTYETFYYDTANMDMYVAHHNKKANRFKVRTRQYIESDLFFLEIKNKSNKGKTVKKRIKLQTSSLEAHTDAKEFVSKYSPYQLKDLSPVLANTFRRITLVDNDLTERLTIDLDLKAWKIEDKSSEIQLENIAIIELKRDQNSLAGTDKRLLDLRIKTMGFSKYAISSSLLFADKVKNNNFKKKHRIVSKLSLIK